MKRFETKEFEYVLINYKTEDAKDIDKLGEYVDSCALDIINFFELDKLTSKAQITIIPTKSEFDELFKQIHGFEAGSSSRGFVNQNNGEIIYLSINDYKNTSHKFDELHFEEAFELYQKTLVHEFVHFVNQNFIKANACDRPAKYLSEGIAIYLSKQKENKQIKFNFSFEDIAYIERKSCYDGWYLATKYLVENYDKDFVIALFKNHNKAMSFLENELYNKAAEFYGNCINEKKN